MLISLVLTCLTTLVIATAGLLAVGHRLRVSAIGLSAAAVICISVAGGEVAARLFLLPAGHVLVAEAVLVIVGIGVALSRRRWNPVGVAFFAALITAAASYLALAAYVTVAGGLSIPAALASAIVLVLETLALVLAASFAFETCDVACRTGPDRELATADPAHLPFVSLHVAAYNEPPDMLIETIQSLEAIDYPHFEIVVVDNNTTDEEVWWPVQAYCAEREKVTFVHVEPWPGFKSGALNLALGVHTDLAQSWSVLSMPITWSDPITYAAASATSPIPTWRSCRHLRTTGTGRAIRTSPPATTPTGTSSPAPCPLATSATRSSSAAPWA